VLASKIRHNAFLQECDGPHHLAEAADHGDQM
jgi:hypothetical protein